MLSKKINLRVILIAYICILSFFIINQLNSDDSLSNDVAVSSNEISEFFVATNGNDNNEGSFNSPFKTISKCASIVKPGGKCFIRGGIYRESVDNVPTGKENQRITFTSYKNEKVEIR